MGFKYAPVDSLKGCIRIVPEEIFDRYNHYIKEVIPFWHLYNLEYINKSYFEIYNFFQEIYKKYPIVNMLDNKGKVIPKKRVK